MSQTTKQKNQINANVAGLNSFDTKQSLQPLHFAKKRIEILDKYSRSNQDTCLVHKPAVTIGEWVQSGDLLADSSASMNGELAIGKNILVAYMPWEGYNYEDAILINERLVYDDVYTSVHIERYEIETKEGQLGSDQITREIPDLAPDEISHLDANGIAKVGSWIEEGDILVGKVTPINKKSQTPYQKLLFKLLDKSLNSVRDSSLRAPKGIKANVINVHILEGVKEKLQVSKPSQTKVATSVKKITKNDTKRVLQAKQQKVVQNKLPNAYNKMRAASTFACSAETTTQELTAGLNQNAKHANFSSVAQLKSFSGLNKWMGFKQTTNTGQTQSESFKTNTTKTSLINNSGSNYNNQSNTNPNKFDFKSLQLRSASTTQSWISPSLKTFTRSKTGILANQVHPKQVSVNNAILSDLPMRSNNALCAFSWQKATLFAGQNQKVESILTRSTVVTEIPTNYVNPAYISLNRKKFSSARISTVLRSKRNSLAAQIRFPPLRDLKSVELLKNYSVRKAMFNKRLVNFEFKSSVNTLPSISGASKIKNTPLLRLPSKASLNLQAKQAELVLQQKSKFTPTLVHIYLAEKRKIQVGDKMAGRHGNKGIISNILPREDMPFLPDGTPIDIVLNPLGVPSRMNVGQIYECLLGLAGRYLGEHFKIFPFDEIYGAEASRSFVFAKLFEARKKTGIEWIFDPNSPGKMRIFDGRTSEGFDQPVTVGIAYMLKLVHMVDDKIHARSTGPYSLVTQQPLRGRAKQGGQRLGEMEVWAIEGYGAAFVLLEMLTLKSDDMTGRLTLWSNIILNKDITIGTPESFKVLVCELQALCLDIGLFRVSHTPLHSNLGADGLQLQGIKQASSSDLASQSVGEADEAKQAELVLQQKTLSDFNSIKKNKANSKSVLLQEISNLMLLP